MKKKLAFILAFVILSVSIFAIPVMAENQENQKAIAYDDQQLFDGNTKYQTGWVKDSYGNWYYYNSDGTLHTGWLKDNGKWYYLNSYGRMLTGWQDIGGKWYYLKESGAMATGWIWLPTSGGGSGWFYLSPSGAQLTGWQKIDGYWYYLDEIAYTDGIYTIDGKDYMFAASGKMLTGWQKRSNLWYYMSSSGAMLTGWQKIGGYWYYLNKAAYTDGIFTIGSKKYLFAASGKMLTGWQKAPTTSGSIEWFYFDSNGAMHIGWLKDGGKWYYLNEAMYHGGYAYIGGVKYIFADNGVCTNPY